MVFVFRILDLGLTANEANSVLPYAIISRGASDYVRRKEINCASMETHKILDFVPAKLESQPTYFPNFNKNIYSVQIY